jgi:hypothetical protein
MSRTDAGAASGENLKAGVNIRKNYSQRGSKLLSPTGPRQAYFTMPGLLQERNLLPLSIAQNCR